MSVDGTYIRDKGGDKIVYFLFDQTTNTLVTASLVSGTNFMDMGEISQSNPKIVPTTTPIKNEAGRVVQSDREYEGNVEYTAMQTSKELLDWRAFTMRGNLYILYKYEGLKGASKKQEIFAVIDPDTGFTMQTPGNRTAFAIKDNMVARDVAVALSTTQLGTMRTAIGLSTYPYITVAVSIPANQECLIYET